MITGRLTAGEGGHAYQENTFDGVTLHEVKRSYVASVFDVVHDRGLRAAMAASKPKFDLFRRSYDESHGATDRIPPDHGRRKIDQAAISSYEDAQTLEVVMGLLHITTPPSFLFVHFSGTDIVGHDRGFDVTEGSAYLEEVRRQDGHVGRILFAIDARRSLAAATVVIVTTDHGGEGNGHADPNMPAHYRIPFIVWGAGIRAADLYALNAKTREDPKDRKEGARPPIRNCDAGNLALSLLGLPPIPGSVVGAAQDLVVASVVVRDAAGEEGDRVRLEKAGPPGAAP